jgi:hypothetical protein
MQQTEINPFSPGIQELLFLSRILKNLIMRAHAGVLSINYVIIGYLFSIQLITFHQL